MLSSKRTEYVEKMGTGINRIKEECKKQGNVNFKIEINGFFIATFKLKKIRDTIKDTIKFLPRNERIILTEIGKKPQITSEELALILKINLRNTRKNLNKLKKKGLLKRIGPAKGGHWKIITK